MARPRTPVGAYGSIAVRRRGDRVIAETRIRDADGRIRHVRVTAPSAAQARLVLKERLLDRPMFGSTRVLTSQRAASPSWQRCGWPTSTSNGSLRGPSRTTATRFACTSFRRSGTTRSLRSPRAGSSGSSSRKPLSPLAGPTIADPAQPLFFGSALRHDAVSRNPVAGTSPMRHLKSPPKALTLEQIAAIRAAAKGWRTQPALPGPKPDGQVRDIIGVLLGTALRTGEVLALRPCDLDDRPTGMVLAVIGTVVQRQGEGAIRQHRPKSEASIRWTPCPSSPPWS